MRLMSLLLICGLLAFAQKGKEDPVRKLTDEEKIELLRGLTAEYATVRAYLPRSKKPLKVNSDGTWNKSEWSEAGSEYGPVVRTGDKVQVTKVDVEDDRIVLQINGGLNVKGKWYERIQAGAGSSGQTVPISSNQSRSAGTTIAVVFPGKIPPIKPNEIKTILKPLLDFEKRSATQDYFESLPPEIQEAIKAKRAEVGMTKEQVTMALGYPRDKLRESKDGVESEDWIYGLPPGKITFVTFESGKVSKVKDSYAGLGGSTAPPLKPPQ